MKEMIDKIVSLVEASGGTLQIDLSNPAHKEINDAMNVELRSELATKYQCLVRHEKGTKNIEYIRRVDASGASAPSSASKSSAKSAPAKKPVVKPVLGSASHDYIMPSFADEIRAFFKCAEDPEKFKACNIRVVGPHGSGKSVFFRKIADEMFGNYYQVNGYADLDPAVLLGERTIKIDKVTQQSFLAHKKGMLELAMTEGLKKDADGNVELDKNGNVQIIGKPALMFIDEYAAIPETVNIALNRVLEIPDEPGKPRVLEVASDGGRRVLSHPGFCVALSGNTIGKGLASEVEQMYTAQDIQQDSSTLSRITATFQFGYNLKAEKQILMKKLGDDLMVSKFIQFRDAIRKQFQQRNVESLFSTRDIVQIADAVRTYKISGIDNPEARALYRCMFTSLMETEKMAWNETINTCFGVDVVRMFADEDGVWNPSIIMS